MRSILVPVDFSACSRHAARYAGELARAVGAHVELLHVWSEPEELDDLRQWYDSLDDFERGNKSLMSWVSTSREGPLNELAVELRRAGLNDVDTRVMAGRPAPTILAATKDHDLIVMGTHGRHGLVEFLIGSVAERVARRCPVPVLLVPLPSGG